MITLTEAIIDAFKVLGGIRSNDEIKYFIKERNGNRWKSSSINTNLTDMVPAQLDRNMSSTVPQSHRVLERFETGKYRLFKNTPTAITLPLLFIQLNQRQKVMTQSIDRVITFWYIVPTFVPNLKLIFA